MNDRIHQVLDGELSRDALDAAERQELAAFERALDSALNREEPTPDVSHSVLWRVRELEPVPAWLPEPLIGAWQRLERGARWLWSPRPVRIRPAYALMACALLALVPVLDRDGAVAPPASVATSRMLVEFRLAADEAHAVSLVGDFTNWQPEYELQQVSPGVWSIAVPLEAGIYEYAFVIDGERWQLDPLAPQVSDGFGGANSRVSVLAPERTSAL